jgi:Predicted esterase of the alpha/beta hydrolase fold
MALMHTFVLFIHGAGAGACAADRLLADSLQRALGADYEVLCPQMPDEDDASYPAWKAEIDLRLATTKAPVALVGHSVGGSVLLKYLCDEQPSPQIAGLFVIAAPYWGASEFWSWDEAALPADAAARLAGDWPLIFYQSRDDEVVPFAHLSMYAAKLPRATIREFAGLGHQFNNDLTEVAADIKKA